MKPNRPIWRQSHDAKANEQARFSTEFPSRYEGEPAEYRETSSAGWVQAVGMPCTNPLRVYKKPDGGIGFNSKEGWADLPFELPCGKCMHCRVRKQRDWAIRCMHEAQMVNVDDLAAGRSLRGSSFVTLTYDKKHLPENAGLDVEDWKNFAKKMRRDVGKFRFFHCGEYGDEKGRPHFHALIFGQDFSADKVYEKGEGEFTTWTSDTLSEIWGKGRCNFGSVSYSSANYVASYVLKKMSGDKAVEHYYRPHPTTGEMFHVRPEYVTMSRRPGLGASWYDKFKTDLYPRNECIVGGVARSVPRYYAEKMKAEDPELFRRIRNIGIRQTVASADDLTPERLAVRDVVLKRSMEK